MARIQLVQTQDKDINQLQRNIAKVVEPVASNPLVNGLILQDVPLVSGDNVINHKLGRTLQGWVIVRKHGNSTTTYDKQDTNATPNRTLVLSSTGTTTVDIYVF
jgi:hypothetical protein